MLGSSKTEMERSGVMYRNANLYAFNAYRAPCRQFLSGSCRFGPSCRFSHELPVLPSVPVCRYFQNGLCWFGDRCRYQHVPHLDGMASGSRRGSAPAVHPSRQDGLSLPGRRGSEPTLLQVPGSQTLGRRGSEPLVSSLVSLQPNFEHLTTDIVEEEEQGSEGASSRPLEQQVSAGSSYSAPPTASKYGCSALPSCPLVAEVSSTPSATDETRQGPSAEMETMETLHQQEIQGVAAAACLDRALPEEYEQSKDMVCGICMDKVYEKPCPQERRFGILPNCSHAFCLGCIATWRKTKVFQEEVIKACPQCRVKSSFYIPSKYWVSDGEPKQTLITAFKKKSSKIRCTFFMRHGCCPFKSECIYRHELPSGSQPRRCHSRMPYNRNLEQLESETLRLLHCFITLTLLDDGDLLDEDSDYFELYLDDDPL